MKKRLFTMLLLLCLLLTALTATVAAESTNANGGHLEFTFNGRTVTFVLSFNYVCENKHNTHDGYFTYNLNSVQAKKADGTLVSMAEWKPEDTICADITVSGIHCYVCDEKIDGTITKTVEFTGADVANFCHLTRNSNNALTAEMQHIRGADTNDRIKFKFYCHLYPFYPLEYHTAGDPTCKEDGYDTDWYRCPLCGKSFSNSNGTGEITVKPRLGHDFDENGVCQRCGDHAEAYISSITTGKTYYDTAANAISKATAPAESVHVVSYTRNDPITINKIVYLTVANGVTVPEIRMESFSDGSTVGSSVKIDNYGTVKLFSSAATVPSRYPGVSYTNHNVTERITAASTIAVQVMQISNKGSGTIGEINIPQTDNPTPKVQVTNNGGKIERLTGSPKNVELRSGTGRYGTITTAAEGGSVDSLLNKGCYFYFPNGGQKWVNSNAGKTVSDVIVSNAPFTVKVNRDGTALTASNGSYNVEGVNVGEDVALSAVFTSNENGLTADESKITSRWYYKNESKTAADGKALTLNNIQYGVYDLIFEAKESTYGFTTSVSVTVNVIPPAEKTAISLKTQLTSDEYTKVYDGTTKASEILPPIEFQLADEREIRIPADCYTFKAEYASPDCITDNKIIVEVTLTEEGEKYYTLTDSKIEVPATITPYDGEWYDGVQHYKAFFVGLSDAGYDGSASIGRNVLPYLQLKGNMYDAVKKELSLRNITPEDGFQYSFYHLRPGAKEPDPELDELLTADSVFTYPEDEYHFYAVVKPSLNYAECITDTSHFKVRDTYSGAHTHDSKTYAAWDGSSLSIASGGTATRYLSGAQPNVNVELVLGQNKTLDLCLYNKAVHVIGSSYDQIYLAGGSTLVLSDCTKTGKIIGSKVKSGSGGVAYVKNGTLSVYDIKLTGGSASTGGAVTVDAKGVLNIYSGEISGNTVTNGKGGAIYIKSGGVVNIFGGTIKDNHVYSGSGGAIYVEAGGTLNLYGGTITGNTASGLGGGIYVEAGGRVNIQGAPVVTGNTAGGKANNVYVCADSTSPLLTISGKLTDGAKLGVSTDASYPVLLANREQDYSAYFTPDDPDAFVLFSGSALTLCAKPSATLEGDTLTVKTGSNYKPDAFVLFVAEYNEDGRLLAVHSEKITPESGTYTFTVQPGAEIKCFLLRTDTYTPLFAAFSPKA